MITPNHTSYIDHFVLEFLIQAARDQHTWYLTKAESLRHPLGRAWVQAWRGVAVDRENPSAGTLREVRRLLRSGDGLCVYPEGTRNSDPARLAPFKPGAFHFAASGDVPIIPVVITGAAEVLPRNARLFRRGRIDVRFGTPILANSSLPKPERVDDLLRRARGWMEATLQEMLAARSRDVIAENGLDARASELIRRGETSGTRWRSLSFVVRCLDRSTPNALGPVKARARMDGASALARRAPLRTWKLVVAMRALTRAIRLDTSDHEAHYFLGEALTHVPGHGDRAIVHLERAIALSEGQDARPVLTLAEAEVRFGRREHAKELLSSAGRLLDDPDQRTPGRLARLEKLRHTLQVAT